MKKLRKKARKMPINRTMPLPIDSPWLTAREAARYLKRGQSFVRREIHAGRLRAALIGGRGEVLTRREWCDQWVTDQATPIRVRHLSASEE
jgi:excisionase family DNA binding protein